MTPQTPEPTALQNFMDSAIVSYGLKIVGAIAVIMFLLLISKFIARMVRRNIVKNADEKNKQAEKIAKLMGDIIFYVLVIFSFFIGFEMVGFNVGLIVWGISFGVWLAFKEILWNMVAGIMILYTKEFKLWDIVEINADQVYFGRIEEITIRYTIIRTIDLRQVVIPNTTLISVPIKTFSSEPFIKLAVLQRADYDSDPNKVIEVIKNAVNSVEFVKNKQNTKVFVNEWRDSYVEYKSFFEFDPNCWLLHEIAIAQVSKKIYEELLANGIDCPYDIKTINFETKEDQQKIQETIQEKITREIQQQTSTTEQSKV
jgi:small conductance mechanosensitive channel